MEQARTIDISYGEGAVALALDPELAAWEVIAPQDEPALTNPEEAFRQASSTPVGAPPLAEVVGPTDQVVIATSDGTRPVPNRQLIPWILEQIAAPDGNVTVLVGTGTHRPNTPTELAAMFGDELLQRVRIVNHNAFDAAENLCVGQAPDGAKVWLNRRYVEADKRIVVGFIEPHFFAGFSGGTKGVAPAVAGIETISHLHRAALIGDPLSTWGTLEENPIRREIAAMVSLAPPDFLVNVALNPAKAITAFFLGHHLEAHRCGCEHVKNASMAPVESRCPLVVTSNSGYPLDQNLYQTVKGMSAAARIIEPGGTILVASECRDGIPAHGNFARLMQSGATPAEVLALVEAQAETVQDQWQAQVLCRILAQARVRVLSSLTPDQLAACQLEPVDDLDDAVRDCLAGHGGQARAAVLPNGPITIPYVRAE